MNLKLWNLIKAYIEAKIDERLADPELDDVSDALRVMELDEEIKELIDRESKEISQIWDKINGMEND